MDSALERISRLHPNEELPTRAIDQVIHTCPGIEEHFLTFDFGVEDIPCPQIALGHFAHVLVARRNRNLVTELGRSSTGS